jgi:serine/threonine protein kinase
LKPENIFLDGTDHIRGGSGEVYPVRHLVFVADLELADAYRRAGVASGSRPYMAPEQHQALNSREPGLDFSKVDVFAIGVMLVEMLTGGYHPVGERRSLIWPTQSPGYQKWKRDMPWKQWINSGAPVAQNIPSLEPSLANLVRQCLAPFSTRINKANLELLLRRELASRDDYVFQTVNLLLMQADSDAVEGAEAGWPYYDELKARIEHFFASAQYNDH